MLFWKCNKFASHVYHDEQSVNEMWWVREVSVSFIIHAHITTLSAVCYRFDVIMVITMVTWLSSYRSTIIAGKEIIWVPGYRYIIPIATGLCIFFWVGRSSLLQRFSKASRTSNILKVINNVLVAVHAFDNKSNFGEKGYEGLLVKSLGDLIVLQLIPNVKHF